MKNIEEIEDAIESLPEKDYKSFREWFYQKDWEKWDHQIVMDSKNGKLDFLKNEASDAKENDQFEEI